MNPIVHTVSRYEPSCGWVNRILTVDLSTMRASVRPSADYLPDLLGGRGLAAGIVWDEYPTPVDPFAPECPLIITPGALTGSRSPYSGRTNVSTFSPQAWPYPWFTRSNIGGHFGGELKRAGYDALVVTGASDSPVRILVRDDEVTILPADDLWGLDAVDTLEAVEASEGRGVRSLAIGPAGERLSRIATIQTASSSACGHGGFGAVMGAKKLKAISVIGTGRVALADPERLEMLTRAIGAEARSTRGTAEGLRQERARLAADGGGRVRAYACTESCPSPCNLYYEDVPGVAHNHKWSGHMTCVGGLHQGVSDEGPISHGGVLDWGLGLRAGLEMNLLANRYGLNQWEVLTSIVPWLEMSERAGLIHEFNGRPFDWRSPAFWAEFLHAVAYREGLGDAIAEGGWAAAHQLNLGVDIARRYYTGWGFSGHWDGHGCWHNPITYPFWLVPALQWLTDTRDPIPSGHGYVHAISLWAKVWQQEPRSADAITWEQMRAIAGRIYGDPAALDPFSGYQAKAYPAFWHTRRSVIKDCLPVDDCVFPMIYSPNTPDHFCRVAGIDGPSLEYHLFTAGTGTPWTEAEFERAAERVYSLERAISVRHWGRDRALDELVLPSFEYRENWQNPLLEQRYALDRAQFTPVMDAYYAHRGWDVSTGWPTLEHLRTVGLEHVYAPMLAGAQRAQAELPERPVLGPVPVLHE